METDLPILIHAKSDCIGDNTQLMHYFGQLQAWLNFQGMSANWYHDEVNIYSHRFYLLSEREFDAWRSQATDYQSLKLRQVGIENNAVIYESAIKKSGFEIDLYIRLDEKICRTCCEFEFNQNPLGRVFFELAKRTLNMS